MDLPLSASDLLELKKIQRNVVGIPSYVKVSSYLKEAVNYLNKFWKEIFIYLKDGNYPIDNNCSSELIVTYVNIVFSNGLELSRKHPIAF